MKLSRLHRLLSVYLLIAAIGMIASCSRSGNNDRDSAEVVADSIPAAPVQDILEAQITNLGIADIHCGVRVNSLTPSVENLYDSIAIEEGMEYTVYRFMLDGADRFTGYEFGDGTIDLLAAADKSIYVDTPKGRLTLGMPFTSLLSLPEAEPEYQTLDDNGMWSWRWQGLYFLPSQENLPQSLGSKLYNQASTPTAADFDDSVVIDYIGTGLPY